MCHLLLAHALTPPYFSRTIDVSASGSYAVVTQDAHQAHLVKLAAFGRGHVERRYVFEDPGMSSLASYDFGAQFGPRDAEVVFGCAHGYVHVWDRDLGVVSRGLDHGAGTVVQAVAVRGYTLRDLTVVAYGL